MFSCYYFPERLDHINSSRMSRTIAENVSVKNVTPSPPTVPTSIKNIYSKIISSCQRSDLMSCSLTPESKENINCMVSPFIKKKVPFNPFNQNLKERLENSILSPDVFQVTSPTLESNEFKWTIDELANIKPAQIEEEFHYEEQVDEKTESEMQNTIDRYFTRNHMVPSPWNCRLPTSWSNFRDAFRKENQNRNSASSSPISFSVSVFSKTPMQDVSTETNLSFPRQLPENIEALLKPYSTEINADDINLNMNNSLRRKLFFPNDDEQLSPVSLFNVTEMIPLISNCCPATPVIELRSDYSPLKKPSPLDISPINHIYKESLCNNSFSPTQVVTSSCDTGIRSNVAQETQMVQVSKNESELFGKVCFKVFESPKLTDGVRRSRKRRRSFSQNINMSISYSKFNSKHNSTKQSTQKLCACDEDSRISEDADTMVEYLAQSQDTVKSTAGFTSDNLDKLSRNESNFELAAFNS